MSAIRASMADLTASGFSWSENATPCSFLKADGNCSTSASNASRSRPATVTFAPCAARAAAHARPIPRVAPLTQALRPTNEKSIFSVTVRVYSFPVHDAAWRDYARTARFGQASLDETGYPGQPPQWLALSSGVMSLLRDTKNRRRVRRSAWTSRGDRRVTTSGLKPFWRMTRTRFTTQQGWAGWTMAYQA